MKTALKGAIVVLLIAGVSHADQFVPDLTTPSPPPRPRPSTYAASCQSVETQEYLTDPSILGCRVPLAIDQSGDVVAQIMTYFQTSGVRNMQGLMACLPEEFRKNFMLARNSQSPQGAPCSDAQNPRMVLFSSDGKTMIAFPGNPGASPCNNIEVVTQNRTTGSYEPAKITFPPPGAPSTQLPTAHRGDAAGCVACHGGNGENWIPKWNAYPSWPGFYGQMDDGFGKGVDGVTLGNPTEEREYLQFSRASYARADGTGGRGLYRFLMRPRTPDPTKQDYAPFNYDATTRAMPFRPNFAYTAAMLRANSDRIANRLASAPTTMDRKYSTLAILLGCPVPASTTTAIRQQTTALLPGMRTRGAGTYRRFVESESGTPCTNCTPVPCNALLTQMSNKQVGSFCPDLTGAPGRESATLIVAARNVGMSNDAIDDLFPSESSVAGGPDYQSYVLSGSSGNVSRMAASASLLRRLSQTNPELSAYLSTDPANPICAEPAPTNPVLQTRCVAPETCALPSLTASPSAGAPNICAKLRELQAASAPGSSGGSSGAPAKAAQ